MRTKGRIKRLLMGALAPPLVGAFLFMVYLGEYGQGMPRVINDLTAVLFLGYLLGGIQSFVYSLLMEFLINPKAKTDTIAIFISAVIGAASGLVIDQSPELAAAGFLVGGFMGYILRNSYKNSD